MQEKQREAYIPAMTEHRELFARRPELARYTARERFGAERKGLGAVAALDLSRADALKAAIHEFDPEVDRIDETPAGGDDLAPEAGVAAPSEQAPALAGAPRPEAPEVVAPVTPRRWDVLDPPGPLAPDRSGLVDVAGVVESGDVLVIDPSGSGALLRSSGAGDRAVTGVAVGDGELRVPVASTGVALCKVDASFGAVRPGDLLVTSPTPGHAMRHEAPSPGTVLGKAMQSLAAGQGRIKVMVTLQ